MPIRSEEINKDTPFRLKLAQLHQNTQSYRLSVPPLSYDEEAELIERSLGLSPSLTKKIIEQTKGIPQLSIQIINDLVMRGTLIPKSEGFVIADGKQIEIPQYLEQDWAEQIQSAFKEAKPEHVQSIETASVFDNHVNHDLWRKVLAIHNLPYPNRLLNILFNKNILKKWKNNRGFSFTHPLYRKIVRSNIDPRRQQSIHTSIADLLSPYTKIKQREIRASHIAKAENWNKALELYGICLNKRIRESNDVAIEKNLNQIKSIVALANFSKSSKEEGTWLILQLRYQSHYGNWTEFDAVLDKLEKYLIQNPDPEIKIQRTAIVGWRLVHQGKIPSAIQHFQLGLRLASKNKEALPTMVKDSVRRCHMGIFDSYSHVDRIDDLGTALHQARPYFSINDDRDHFLSYLHRGSFFYRRCGNFVKARQIAEQALNLAIKHGLVLHIAIAHNNIGDMDKEQTRFQSAKEHFHKAYRLFQQIGNVYALMALYNIGATLMLQQQIDEATDLFQQVLKKSSQRDFHLVLIYSHFQLLIAMSTIQDEIGWATHHFQLQGLLKDRRLLNKDLKEIILTAHHKTLAWSPEHSEKFTTLIREWLTDNHPFVANLTAR
jgi:tetratricopeptide (TPR) repeat protein